MLSPQTEVEAAARAKASRREHTGGAAARTPRKRLGPASPSQDATASPPGQKEPGSRRLAASARGQQDPLPGATHRPPEQAVRGSGDAAKGYTRS